MAIQLHFARILNAEMDEFYWALPQREQRLEQYWFLRKSETGLHMFSRSLPEKPSRAQDSLPTKLISLDLSVY